MSQVLDAQQLARIEAVHRGFLYQHLYAVSRLLCAQSIGATSVVVERDEDLEITFPGKRIYVQVKTRSVPLTYSDIEGALKRFDALRIEHSSGRREGRAAFVIAANVAAGPALSEALQASEWIADVQVHWPGNSVGRELPEPWPDVSTALTHCTAIAASLPYALLAPETLVWKLAGHVMAAAAGTPPRTDHMFRTGELPDLFEQVVVQLQDFPAPPPVYRAVANEPALFSDQRVRIVTGHSGAGKTAWVSQTAVHATDTVAYFDVTETPGPGLAAALARELAARLFGRTGGRLGEVLLPGSSGAEILQRIGARLSASGRQATVVLDNAHRVPPPDVQTLTQQASDIRFLLLCHPGRHAQELEARLSVSAERLGGWPVDTIAIEVAEQHCRGDYAACQRLATLTGGMPLYVQNAISIAATQYEGSISRLCDELEARTHVVETAQELILARVFDALSAVNRDGMAVLSLPDVPLTRKDVSRLLMTVFGFEQKMVASVLRELRTSGCLEFFGGDRLKVHDAVRLLGQSHLQKIRKLEQAQVALKDVVLDSLGEHYDLPKVSLLLRMLAATGDIKTIVGMATDELFHELGLYPEIHTFLEAATRSENVDAEQRFWALDGLVFADMKRGDVAKATERQALMARIIADHNLGVEEVLALSMKKMNVLAHKGDDTGVLASIRDISKLLPSTPSHRRIFRYNAAHALFSLGRYEAAIDETFQLMQEYFRIVGIEPKDVIGRNPDKLWPLLKKTPTLRDDLKHLADCLDLHAQAMNRAGRDAPFARIHAMKFYSLASAIDSIVRVGQDLVDEFVGRHDFIGAREVIETNLLPNIVQLKMLNRVIPVRSQYAVVLAYCGEFDAAETEMKRLAPYEAGLDEKGQWELQQQRDLIAQLRIKGPPPQWIPRKATAPVVVAPKIGRNAPCPCGSGKKYKRCHGAST